MPQRRNHIDRRDLIFNLLLRQLAEGEEEAALKSLERYQQLSTESQQAIPKRLQDFAKWLQRRQNSPRFALLVGVEGPTCRSAERDVEAWRSCLEEQMGFTPGNITVLTGDKAKREQILLEYNKLVAQSRRFPTLFVYAGIGTVRSGEPSEYGILASDSLDEQEQTCQEIKLKTLADASIKAKTLSVVFDAGWALDYDRAYGVGGYYEANPHRNIPLIGSSMMLSAWQKKNDANPIPMCLEAEAGGQFSRLLIEQIKAGKSLQSFRDLQQELRGHELRVKTKLS
ncbi:MAG: hypothetical protein AAGM67_04220 [Bacteroidota bacterium]